MSKCVQQNTWLKVPGDSMKSIRKWISRINFKSHPIAITVSGVVTVDQIQNCISVQKTVQSRKNLWIIFFFLAFHESTKLGKK